MRTRSPSSSAHSRRCSRECARIRSNIRIWKRRCMSSTNLLSNGVRAILDALRFDKPPSPLPELSAADLAFADQQHLTPLLSRLEVAGANRQYVTGAAARNAVRMERFRAAYDEMADKFEHVVLKGFTHAPDFVDDIRLRAQYDLDLYVPSSGHDQARDALLALGYEPI